MCMCLHGTISLLCGYVCVFAASGKSHYRQMVFLPSCGESYHAGESKNSCMQFEFLLTETQRKYDLINWSNWEKDGTMSVCLLQ